MLATSDPILVDLLARSRAAHQQYRAQLPRAEQGRVILGDPVRARDALEQAQALRRQARRQDPTQQDAAWGDDDAALRAFYREQLG